ncbi:hypothetical protein, partial [uncultured Salegentibacter sp.]|uniref:hypothetical protein n=1 Tax=uncultured Salegentibacter sp. TaxID=259320 RepID=UPI0030DCC84E
AAYSGHISSGTRTYNCNIIFTHNFMFYVDFNKVNTKVQLFRPMTNAGFNHCKNLRIIGLSP